MVTSRGLSHFRHTYKDAVCSSKFHNLEFYKVSHRYGHTYEDGHNNNYWRM